MIRLLIFFVIVGLVAAGAVWMSDQPGSVTLDWQGYQIRITLLGAAVVAFVGFAVLYAALRFLGVIVRAPGKTAKAMRIRRREKGLETLSQGLIAASSGHVKLADRLSAKAHKLMPREPLTLLLQAQAAQLKGDDHLAGQVYRAMLESRETQTLGLHGLFKEARRVGDNQVAMVIAERAASVEPDSPWAAPALMDLQAADGDWIAAGQTLERKRRHKLVDKAEWRRQQAVLLTARAMEAEKSTPEEALDLALQAHKQAPELVPAAVIAGRVLAQKGRIAKAARVLEKTWKLAPHPDIADVYAHMKMGDKPQARLKRVRFLVHKNPDHPESAIALATAATAAQDWALARSALTPYLAEPTRRVCGLMAEIEDGEFGDKGRVREWLSRALRAGADPVWLADGVASAEWAAVSPVTGALDAFEWKAPPASLPGPELEPDDADAGATGDRVPAALPEPDDAPDEADAAAEPESEPKVIEAKAAAPAPAEEAAKPKAEAPEVEKKPAAEAKPESAKAPPKVHYASEAEIIVPQPDDPGPGVDEPDLGDKPRYYS